MAAYGCPEWCDAVHRPNDHREDRNHFGQELNTPLSLNQLVEVRHRNGPDDVGGGHRRTYLQQHAEWSAAIVQVERDDSSVLELTLDEARCLAHSLLSVCEEAS